MPRLKLDDQILLLLIKPRILESLLRYPTSLIKPRRRLRMLPYLEING